MNNILKITLFICLSLISFVFVSCNDDDREGLDLNGDLKITSFTIGNMSGVINEVTNTIKIVVPNSTDLSKLKPTVVATEGVTITPASDAVVNFAESKTKTYTLTTNNIYRKYTVSVDFINAVFSSFVIDGQKGKIDNTAHTVTVILPVGTDITKLYPSFEVSGNGSSDFVPTVTPNQDTPKNFTTPQIYTISYMGETFTYTVSVELRDFIKVGFLGTESSASSISNPAEKAAYAWFMNNYPSGQYISFDDILSEAVDLSSFSAIWWHLESSKNLPSAATSTYMKSMFQDYHSKGGGLVLTTYAGQYLASLQIANNSEGPNNIFGDDNAWTSPDSWGISFKGHESHPLFQGLTLDSSRPYAVANLVGPGAARYNATARWGLQASEPWSAYTDIVNWRSVTGGIDLASHEWDENHASYICIAEFPAKSNGIGGNTGKTIVIGPGAYVWYSDLGIGSANIYLPNVQRLTSNAIDYVAN